jgi:hypothetical protein
MMEDEYGPDETAGMLRLDNELLQQRIHRLETALQAKSDLLHQLEAALLDESRHSPTDPANVAAPANAGFGRRTIVMDIVCTGERSGKPLVARDAPSMSDIENWVRRSILPRPGWKFVPSNANIHPPATAKAAWYDATSKRYGVAWQQEAS